MKFWRRTRDSEPRTVEGITVFGRAVVDAPEYRSGEITADPPGDPDGWEPIDVPDDARGLLGWVREPGGRLCPSAADAVVARVERLRRAAWEDVDGDPPAGVDKQVWNLNEATDVLIRLARHARATPPAGAPTDPAEAEPETPAEERLVFDPSPDYRTCFWGEERYSFSANQAAAVKVLHRVYPRGVGQHFVLEAIDSDAKRLRDVFRSSGKMNPAWGTMIVGVEEREGVFSLAPQKPR